VAWQLTVISLLQRLDVARQADATARTYCQLLVLAREDFDHLAVRHLAIREHIDRLATNRSAMRQ
jgi:hypothetical protein